MVCLSVHGVPVATAGNELKNIQSAPIRQTIRAHPIGLKTKLCSSAQSSETISV